MKKLVALLGLVLLGTSAASAQDATVERRVHSQLSESKLRVTGAGDVTLERSGSTRLTARASASELRDLQAAVVRARLHDLGVPANVPGPGAHGPSIVVAPATEFFTLTIEGANRAEVSGILGLEGPYAAKLRPVFDVLDAIAARVTSVAAPRAFSSLRYQWTEANFINTILTLSADGRANVVRMSGAAEIAQTIDGAATAAELDAIERAIRGARVASLPELPVPMHIVAGDTFQLDIVSTTAALAGSATGEPGYLGSFEPRLRPLLAALEALATRLVASPPAPRVFTTLRYARTQASFINTILTLSADGRANVVRTTGSAEIAQTIDGTLTEAELDEIERAAREARVESIPDDLPVPMHVVAGETFELEVASATPALAGAVGGEPTYLLAFEARLRPLLTALDAISARIAPLALRVAEAEGVVRVEGGEVYLRQQPATRYRITNRAFADVIRDFAGRIVKVAGRVTNRVGVPGGAASADVEVTAILSPSRQTSANVQVQQGSNRVFVMGDEVTTFGPAARALRLFAGRSHLVGGWLFSDANDRPEELLVEAVSARAKEFSVLTRNGQWAGYVRKDQRVEILGFSGNSALVRAGSRTGYVATSKLEAGEVPVPLHGPTPGLTGSVPGQ